MSSKVKEKWHCVPKRPIYVDGYYEYSLVCGDSVIKCKAKRETIGELEQEIEKTIKRLNASQP